MPPPTGRKPRQSEYGKRLAAKQAARTEYGLRERQFRRYFALARKIVGATGAKLLELLERRLDNVLYRLDLVQTRRQARQWINHGQVLVNDRKVTIPSYRVDVGDVITLKHPDRAAPRGTDIPVWLALAAKDKGGKVLALPARDQIAVDLDEQLIVEFYSR